MQQNIHFLSSLPLTKKLNQFLLLTFSLTLTLTIFVCILLTPPSSSSIFSLDFFLHILPGKPSDKTCDYSFGKWVWDDRLPYTENCPFLDPGFRCHLNGRHDLDYQRWRWQPHGCNLPRFDAEDLLERNRNGRIVFAGDSISRNQWESLICLLAQGVSNISTIYEENGNPITKHKGFLSIRFQEYNLTVQYYRVPYLVVLDRPPPNAPKEVRGVVRVDKMHWFSSKWIGANVVVFSAGHWWNQDKTVKSGHYFQEGDHVNMTMDAMEAFQRSLNTLKAWITQYLQAGKSHVFFRSYSPVHYRNGTWDKGGYCNVSKEPAAQHSELSNEPRNNMIMLAAVKQMESVFGTVKFLNVTYLTEMRMDGHPSNHREKGTPVNAPQDCSHWCLPGVPDTWNGILYAELLKMGFTTTSS